MEPTPTCVSKTRLCTVLRTRHAGRAQKRSRRHRRNIRHFRECTAVVTLHRRAEPTERRVSIIRSRRGSAAESGPEVSKLRVRPLSVCKTVRGSWRLPHCRTEASMEAMAALIVSHLVGW
ncbi:hypothetical protein CUR178_00848 [Leishmania enriettii]|uniref:Uncharacterized protein n=1 Tax=Leishmania enriettii TaxID=5663 RepID=A0A836GGJ9_LEIEN|nr:hypothetical protein CUR178_00848 [Leishmania enriettii]